jgi:hypothetical protein
VIAGASVVGWLSKQDYKFPKEISEVPSFEGDLLLEVRTAFTKIKLEKNGLLIPDPFVMMKSLPQSITFLVLTHSPARAARLELGL